MNENVYLKDKNGSFIPIGLGYKYLPDGIWYVRHHEGCNSVTSLPYLEGLYKLSDPENFKDINKICSIKEYTDFIFSNDEFRNLLNSNYTLEELISLCVCLVFKKNENKK